METLNLVARRNDWTGLQPNINVADDKRETVLPRCSQPHRFIVTILLLSEENEQSFRNYLESEKWSHYNDACGLFGFSQLFLESANYSNLVLRNRLMMHTYPSSLVRTATGLATIALLFLGTQVASAVTLTFEANLDGLQEVPPNASPAFGLGELTLDTVSGAVTITTGTYQDLLGGASFVSLNGMAGLGTNAGVLLNLTLDSPGAATGTFSGGGTLGIMAIGGMQAGNTYINIRSQVFPSGEIRGQLFQVETPEPGSIMLAVFAALGLTSCARRRYRTAASAI
jgi:CHRD domain